VAPPLMERDAARQLAAIEALSFRSSRREMRMSNPLKVELCGPVSAFAPGFLEELLRQGYRSETAAKQLQLMAHVVVGSPHAS
jgi:hypothetical protein